MAKKHYTSTLPRLDVVAVLFAGLLSFTNLARGAVYEHTLIIACMLLVPLLFMALSSVKSTHGHLKIIGLIIFATMGAILAHQQYGMKVLKHQEIVFYAFMLLCFVIALCIGSSEFSARLFLLSTLASGTFCLALTFFVTRNEVEPSADDAYTHGFIYSSDAATYLGVMLLLSLAQGARLFRRPAGNVKNVFREVIEKLEIQTILRSALFFISMLLVIASLIMTSEIGEIFLSLLIAGYFVLMLLLRMYARPRTRRIIVLCAVILLAWGFLNFGDTLADRIEDQRWSGSSLPGTFMHNGYMQFLHKMGAPAFIVIMACILYLATILYRGFKGRKERYITPALGFWILLLVLLHTFINTSINIPALAALVTAILTVCVSQTDPRFSAPPESSSKSVRRVRVRKKHSSKR